MSHPLVTYDPVQILAAVRSHLTDASNRLYHLDETTSCKDKGRLFYAADKAIDAAIAAVDAMTEACR